jgi:hypothetical protein
MKKLLISLLALSLFSIGFCQEPVLISAGSAEEVDPTSLVIAPISAGPGGPQTIRVNSTIIAPAPSATPVVISAEAVRINDIELISAEGEGVRGVSISVQDRNINIIRSMEMLRIHEAESGVNVSVSTQARLVVQESKMYMNISNTNVEISVVPSQAVSIAQVRNQTRAMIELYSESEGAKYRIMEEKTVRLLGLIPLRMNVSSKVDATTGVLEEVIRPWWSFLTIE